MGNLKGELTTKALSRSACTSPTPQTSLKTETSATASPGHSTPFTRDSEPDSSSPSLCFPLFWHIWPCDLLASWPSDQILCWATASCSHGAECEVWTALSLETGPPPKWQTQTSSSMVTQPVPASSWSESCHHHHLPSGCSHFHTVPSSADCPQFRSIVGAPQATSFLPALNSAWQSQGRMNRQYSLFVLAPAS